MRTSVSVALLGVLACGTASAADFFDRPRGADPRVAALYLEVPLGVRDRQRTKPTFGLRLEAVSLAPSSASIAGARPGTRTLLDLPLLLRKDDPLRDSGAAMLLGKGMIVGIVVGAVVAVSVISDDDDDGY